MVSNPILLIIECINCIKPNRSPQEAIDLFDITICGTSFYGGDDWVVPSPDLSFARQSELNCTVANKITLQFMDNLHTQANRSFDDIVCEMGLVEHMIEGGHSPTVARRHAASAKERLGPNVFLSSDNHPSFPYTYPTYEISFLRLVFDIKCHLIYRAVLELFEQGFDRYSFMHDLHDEITSFRLRNTESRLNESKHPLLLLHRMFIGRFVSRYEKYTERGIAIHGVPDFEKYKQSGILKSVDNLLEMSKGMSLFVCPDFYYKVDEGDDTVMDMELEANLFDEDDSDVSMGGGHGTSGMARFVLDEEGREFRDYYNSKTQIDLVRWLERNNPGLAGINEDTREAAIRTVVEH